MNLRPKRIADVALLEARGTKRLARFWTFVFVLSLCSIMGYAISCMYLGSVAPTSPSLGAGTPLYLLGSIEPTFFLLFQAAVLFLLFDSSQQHSRSRIEEVLNAKPVSNIEYLLGRVLGISGLVWLVVVVNVLAMQIYGVIANATNFDFGGTFQVHSLINLLLLDVPATLLFWGALVVFLSQILRFRILVVAVGLAGQLAWFTLVLEVPYSLLGIFTPSSNDTLFVSDLIPEFASWPSICIRLATLFLAGALVVFAAILSRRWENTRLPVILPATGVLLVASVATYSLGASSVVDHFNASHKWRELHANYNWNQQIDVTDITGGVRIDPGRRLDIDLTVRFFITNSDGSPLVFTLNPGMNIEEQSLDGEEIDFSFQNGLLELQIPLQTSRTTVHSLRIVASGIPDPRFAYFDGHFDYIATSDVQKTAVSAFGRDGSVFHRNFVALTPGTYWYPRPGVVNNSYESPRGGKDYFDLDLDVDLVSRDWTLIGTGVESVPNETRKFHVNPSSPVAEIGLLASDYRTESFQIDDLEFSLHLHKRHARNLPVLSLVEEAFRTELGELLNLLTRHDLDLVHKSLAFAEVPRRLRTVSGGWRMDSADNLPGLILVKEHGFPTARLGKILDQIDRSETETSHSQEIQLEVLSNYFQMGLAGDNPWASLPKRLWTDATSATGEFSPVLDQIMLSLVSMVTREELHPFSIYWANNVLDMAQISPFGASLGVESLIEDSHSQGAWRTLQRLEDEYRTRVSVWNNATSVALSELPTLNGNKHDLELLLLKCSAVAKALLSLNGADKIEEWLGAVRKQHAGGNFTHSDLIATAKTHEITVDPFLTDWIRSPNAPGYVISPMTISRMKDNENGDPQYQTSVQLRNTGDVAGYVRLRFPNESSRDWRFPVLTDSEAVRVNPHTSKTINLVTGYEPRLVHLDPGFSLNRNEIALTRSSPSVEERPDSEIDAFEADSSWQPEEDAGIIVDDLDSGFVVFQDPPNLNRQNRVGPLGWLRDPRMAGELDNGLPFYSNNFYLFEYRWSRGVWHRLTAEGGYGEYRTTAAHIWVPRGQELPKAIFQAQIPESGNWQLEYHFPQTTTFQWMRDGIYRLNVTDGSASNSVSIGLVDLKKGWNKIGEYDLSAGMVHVEFVGASNIGRAIADAIKWTKAG